MANLPDLMKQNRSLFSDFFRDLDTLFNTGSQSFFPDLMSQAGGDFIQPKFDLQEQDKNYLLSVDVPGVKKEDLKIDFTGNVLSVSGERRSEFSDQQTQSRRYGRFMRSWTLPTGITADQIEAHYDNGVLEVLIPKVQDTGKKSIEVKSGRLNRDQQIASNVTKETQPRH